MRDILRRILHWSGEETIVRRRGRTFSVSETDSSKTFSINGTIQSVMMKNSEYSRDYWDLFPPLCYAFDMPRVLMIGLGGGTIARQIGARFGDRVSIDIVEIDSEVVRLSRQFFDSGHGHRITVGDGASAVRSRKNAYDIIILDAYEGDLIPEQFLREGFARDAHDSLKNHGVLAINYISTMRYNGALDDYMRVLSAHFSVYEATMPRITSNSVVVCTKNVEKKGIVERMRRGLGFGNYDLQILSAYENMRLFSAESRE